MSRRNIRDHRGITDVDVMWLMFIPGIVAAIVVPLYTGYVEKARVSEAVSIMETMIISQQEEKERTTNFYSVSLAGGVTDIVAFMAKGIDVSDTEFFTYETAATGVKPNDGFTVRATSTEAFGAAGGTMTYTYDPAATPGNWAADGTIILPDMLPTHPCISASGPHSWKKGDRLLFIERCWFNPRGSRPSRAPQLEVGG